MLRLLLATTLAALCAFGEDLERIKKARLYMATCSVTTDAAKGSCALAVPAAIGSSVKFVLDSVVVNTPDTSVTFGFGGTLPTATDVTSAATIKRNTTEDPLAKVYSTPDSTDETKTVAYGVTAATDKVFDMSGVVLNSALGQRVLKMTTTNNVTGTTTYKVFWAEMQF